MKEKSSDPIKQMIQAYPMILDGKIRTVSSLDGTYNYIFNKTNGKFLRCGKSIASYNDPPFSPLGPEILDLEISTICHGIHYHNCKFCYKGNTDQGKNMTFEIFQEIFHKMPPNLTQIAFGIGDIDGNPDMLRMFDYCRNNPYNIVIPNVTINGDRLTESMISQLANLCGAISVSHYDDDLCFNAVQHLTNAGLKQVNIHQLVAEETYEECVSLLNRVENEPRLAKLNAIVFLALKPKGGGKDWHTLSFEKYSNLINYAFDHKISIGFDSCSSFHVISAIQHQPTIKMYESFIEPCESTLFSSYITVDGIFYPCSFSVGENGFSAQNGLDVRKCVNFLDEIWYHPSTILFRNLLLETTKNNTFKCRTCPLFRI